MLRMDGLRDVLQRVLGMRAILLDGEIAERDDADQTLVAAQHRQAAHLKLAHIARYVVDRLVLEDIFDVGRHDVAHLAILWLLAGGDGAYDDVAIGYHADEPVVLADR